MGGAHLGGPINRIVESKKALEHMDVFFRLLKKPQ